MENASGVNVDVEMEDVANDTVEDVEVKVEDDLVYDADREQQSIAIKLMHWQEILYILCLVFSGATRVRASCTRGRSPIAK